MRSFILMTDQLLRTSPFLLVVHSFFEEECGKVGPVLDQLVMNWIAEAISSPTMSPDKLNDKISPLLRRSVTFPQRIHDILTVPNFPPQLRRLTQGVSNGRRQQNPWSADEDNRLLCGIHRFGIDDWGTVANFVGYERSRAQCAQRWSRGLNPMINKCRWSPREDEQLRRLVDRYGAKSWTTIAREMCTRTDVQCGYRWKQLGDLQTPDPPAEQPARPELAQPAQLPSPPQLLQLSQSEQPPKRANASQPVKHFGIQLPLPDQTWDLFGNDDHFLSFDPPVSSRDSFF
jgi:hypothetical protein